MVWLVVLALGLVIGLILGRWWALVAALAFAVWIWATTDVEVAHWFLGLAYGGAAAIGIAVGVALRKAGRGGGPI